MHTFRWVVLAGCALAAIGGYPARADSPVDYDIVYVRQPRYGDNINTVWPDVFRPGQAEPGADLMLLHPDGTEEVLVEGGIGSVTDPFVTFDGTAVLYAYFYDLRPESLNAEQESLSALGSDIFRIDLITREITQLTHGEFTPNEGTGQWDQNQEPHNSLGYGILNLGPCPMPGGRIMFTSNRNGIEPPKRGLGFPTMQLYSMLADGSNVEFVGVMNVSNALHPTPLADGRIMFSTHEDQGFKDFREWAVWSIYPDGRHWDPMISSFNFPLVFHFQTQLSNGDIVVEDYYNRNNNGLGALYRFPLWPPEGTPRFFSAYLADNPDIGRTNNEGQFVPFSIAFSPWGLYSLTPFTQSRDQAAPIGSDGVTRVGKFTHPSGGPNNDLLVCWSKGPANNWERPTNLPYYNGGLYLMPNGDEIADPLDPAQLIPIKDEFEYNEAWPRAVVPWSEIHGDAEPPVIPYTPNDGTKHEALPAGTPFALIGSSSLYKRESFPGFVAPAHSVMYDGLDTFNSNETKPSSNWLWQGSDAGLYADSEIWALRIVTIEPNTQRAYGPNAGRHFYSHSGERIRILGEIPVRKFTGDGTPIFDPEGVPDTSFLAKIPADTPWTFHTIDRDGMVLNISQTWHQLRPGEVRTNCGGCHAHSQLPLPFEDTAAGQPGFTPVDLTRTTPLVTKDENGDPDLEEVNAIAVNVEFYEHIRPILERSCVPCHTQNEPVPPGNLVLDDYAPYVFNAPTGITVTIPGDYKRLAADENAQWGYMPMVVGAKWFQSNASRYIRKFQSRRSLLMWKLHGQRLDGWTNADHPTETVLGDVNTLPPGTNRNQVDIDFTGTIMPPPEAEVPPVTEAEKMMIARWIDIGCPINSGQETGNGDFGYQMDDSRPVLAVSIPRAGADNRAPLRRVRIGVADAYSDVNVASFNVTADIEIDGHSPGTGLSNLLSEESTGIYSMHLDEPLDFEGDATLYVEIADNQGNFTRVERKFSLGKRYGDGDDDGVVDLIDLIGFGDCLTGPNGGVTLPCLAHNADEDADVDLGDFKVFQNNFTTP